MTRQETSSRPSDGRWRVDEAEAGERLDRALAVRLGEPRNRIQGWIRSGRVQLDGRVADKSSETLRAGCLVSWSPPPPEDSRVQPEPGDLAILFEDGDLVVLDKPAGLVVHPGAGRRVGTLVHRLVARFPELAGVGGPGRPGIVHRLDRETSGLLVVARNDAAYRDLVRAFSEREVEKVYLAVVHGSPKTDRGEIDAPIARHPSERQRMAVRPRGKPARSSFRVLARAPGATLLAVRIHTGRTHQIRVHLKHAGLPIVGDPVYGGSAARGLPVRQRALLDAFGRPALHAWKLNFRHPAQEIDVRLEAPIPDDLRALWSELGGALPAG